MDDRAPVLLLTRPRPASEAFLGRLEDYLGRSVDCIISPVLEIVDHGRLPDVDPYATLVFSSSNAVERLGREGMLKGRSVRTVGEATAEMARRYGAEAEALGGDVDAFIAHSGSLEGPCLHCRGVHSRGDLAARLAALSIPCDEAVVYDQREVRQTDEATARALSGSRIVAPVFSPRSARLLAEQLPENAHIQIIAISPAAASVWPDRGQVEIAEAPTAEEMLRLVAAAL